MFVLGLVVGMLIGGNVGVMLMALFKVNGKEAEKN